MIILTHPFNRDPNKTMVCNNTRKIILGSFPSNNMTTDDNDKPLEYYYGNTRKFWEIIKISQNLHEGFDKSENDIKNFLGVNNIGIIDIIYKCYRRNDNQSLDSDLSIIELEDILSILKNKPLIIDIFVTSNFVRDIFISKQIRPMVDDHKTNFIKDENGCDVEVFSIFGREIKLHKLKSPSHRAGYTNEILAKDYNKLFY